MCQFALISRLLEPLFWENELLFCEGVMFSDFVQLILLPLEYFWRSLAGIRNKLLFFFLFLFPFFF